MKVGEVYYNKQNEKLVIVNADSCYIKYRVEDSEELKEMRVDLLIKATKKHPSSKRRKKGDPLEVKLINYFEKVRRDNGLTQNEFANSLGVVQSTVSKIENGTWLPDFKVLSILNRKYKVDLNNLVTKRGMEKKYEIIKYKALARSQKIRGNEIAL